MELNYIRLISIFVLLTSTGILYERYIKKYFPDKELDKYDLIKKHLLNDNSNKPILWVHTDYKINSIKWENFYSRNTKDLNQEYIKLCVESIIKYCGSSFNICLIDDEAFDRLLPDWNIDLEKVSNPIKNNLRLLGQLNLLHKYGGIMIPNSTIIFKDLKELYDNSLELKDMFVGEMVNRNISNNILRFMPNTNILGCLKGSNNMKELINYLEILISKDNSSETKILGNIEKKLFDMSNKKKIQIISGKLIGTKTDDDKEILIDDLLNNSYINLHKNIYCICIEKDKLNKRVKYNWFIKLNKDEILKSNIMLGKYLLISKGFIIPN